MNNLELARVDDSEMKLESFLKEFVYYHPIYSSYSDSIKALSFEEKENLVFGIMENVPQGIIGFQSRAFVAILGNFKIYGPLFEQLLGNEKAFAICKHSLQTLWFQIFDILPAILTHEGFETLCQTYNIVDDEKQQFKRLFNLARPMIQKQLQDSQIIQTLQYLFSIYESSSSKCQLSARILFYFACAGSAYQFFQSSDFITINGCNALHEIFNFIKRYIRSKTTIYELAKRAGLPESIINAGNYTVELFDYMQSELQFLGKYSLQNSALDCCFVTAISYLIISVNLAFTLYSFRNAYMIHKQLSLVEKELKPKIKQKLQEIKLQLDACNALNISNMDIEQFNKFRNEIISINNEIKQVIFDLETQIGYVSESQKSLKTKQIIVAIGSVLSLSVSVFVPGVGPFGRAIGLFGGAAGGIYLGYSQYLQCWLAEVKEYLIVNLDLAKQYEIESSNLLKQIPPKIKELSIMSIFGANFKVHAA